MNRRLGVNYEEHKNALLSSYSAPISAKSALHLFDSMDCVEALNYARTLYEMMKKRVAEAGVVV